MPYSIPELRHLDLTGPVSNILTARRDAIERQRQGQQDAMLTERQGWLRDEHRNALTDRATRLQQGEQDRKYALQTRALEQDQNLAKYGRELIAGINPDEADEAKYNEQVFQAADGFSQAMLDAGFEPDFVEAHVKRIMTSGATGREGVRMIQQKMGLRQKPAQPVLRNVQGVGLVEATPGGGEPKVVMAARSLAQSGGRSGGGGRAGRTGQPKAPRTTAGERGITPGSKDAYNAFVKQFPPDSRPFQFEEGGKDNTEIYTGEDASRVEAIAQSYGVKTRWLKHTFQDGSEHWQLFAVQTGTEGGETSPAKKAPAAKKAKAGGSVMKFDSQGNRVL